MLQFGCWLGVDLVLVDRTRQIFRQSRAALADELAKIDRIRRHSSALEARYEDVLTDQRRASFLHGIPHKVRKRSIKRAERLWWQWTLQSAPRAFSGGYFVNLLGWQPLRLTVINRRLRRQSPGPFQGDISLARDGVVLLPGLVSPATVQRITDFYRAHPDFVSNYLTDFQELILDARDPALRHDHFQDEQVTSIVEAIHAELATEDLYLRVSGRPMKCRPFMSVLRHSYDPLFPVIHANADGNDVPHRDVYFPSFKLFVYLNEVTVDNAAFIYFPGTHRVAEFRLRDLYRLSLDYYRQTGDRLNVNPLQYGSQDIVGVDQEGHAGDGVFFDVAGIHKRGNHGPDKVSERMVLLLDFRHSAAFRSAM